MGWFPGGDFFVKKASLIEGESMSVATPVFQGVLQPLELA